MGHVTACSNGVEGSSVWLPAAPSTAQGRIKRGIAEQAEFLPLPLAEASAMVGLFCAGPVT
jgi:hypothetical protein